MEKVKALSMQVYRDSKFMASPKVQRPESKHGSHSDGDEEEEEVLSIDSDPTVGLQSSMGNDEPEDLPRGVSIPTNCSAKSPPGSTSLSSALELSTNGIIKRATEEDLPICQIPPEAPVDRKPVPVRPTRPLPPSTLTQRRSSTRPSNTDSKVSRCPPLPSTPEEQDAESRKSPNTAVKDLVKSSKKVERNVHRASSSSSNNSMPDRYLASRQLISSTRTRRKKPTRRILKSSLDSTRTASSSSFSSSTLSHHIACSTNRDDPYSLGARQATPYNSGATSLIAPSSSSLRCKRVTPARSSMSLPPLERRRDNHTVVPDAWEHPSVARGLQKSMQFADAMNSNIGGSGGASVSSAIIPRREERTLRIVPSSSCSLPGAVKFSELGVNRDEWQHPSLAVKTRHKLKSRMASSSASVGSLSSMFRRNKKEKQYKKCSTANRAKKETTKSQRSDSQSVGSLLSRRKATQEAFLAKPASNKADGSSKMQVPDSPSVAACNSSGVVSPRSASNNTSPSRAVGSIQESANLASSSSTHCKRSILKNSETAPRYTAEYNDHTDELMAALRECEEPKFTWRRRFGLGR